MEAEAAVAVEQTQAGGWFKFFLKKGPWISGKEGAGESKCCNIIAMEKKGGIFDTFNNKDTFLFKCCSTGSLY